MFKRKITTALFAAAALAVGAQPAAADVPATYSPLDYGNGMMLTCSTDWQTGTFGTGNAWGNFIDGCTVKVECPAHMQVCSAKLKTGIYLQDYNGERVTQNARLRAISSSGNVFWHRDTSCDNTNWCANEDMVNIRGGESASVQCNGVRQPSAENTAFNECAVDVEYLY